MAIKNLRESVMKLLSKNQIKVLKAINDKDVFHASQLRKETELITPYIVKVFMSLEKKDLIVKTETMHKPDVVSSFYTKTRYGNIISDLLNNGDLVKRIINDEVEYYK